MFALKRPACAVVVKRRRVEVDQPRTSTAVLSVAFEAGLSAHSRVETSPLAQAHSDRFVAGQAFAVGRFVVFCVALEAARVVVKLSVGRAQRRWVAQRRARREHRHGHREAREDGSDPHLDLTTSSVEA